MTQDNPVSVIVLVLLLIGAGCARVTLPPGHEIDFDGQVFMTEQEFHMRGQLEVDRGAAPDRNFSDVRIVLYDDAEHEISSHRIGSLSVNPDHGPTKQAVNISSRRIPTYVLVESPDFWEQGVHISVVAFRVEDGHVEQLNRDEPDSFPDQ